MVFFGENRFLCIPPCWSWNWHDERINTYDRWDLPIRVRFGWVEANQLPDATGFITSHVCYTMRNRLMLLSFTPLTISSQSMEWLERK
jgi:hypothetical protein